MGLASLVLPPWLSAPLAIARRVPPVVWVALLAVALVLGYGHLRYNAGQANTQTKFDAYRSKVMGAVAIAVQKARAAEAAQRQAFAAIATTHQKDMTDAVAEGHRVAAAVRAGTLRLRDHWTCPAAVSATPADSARAADAAELRAADSGDLVQLGKEADATVRAAVATLKAERQDSGKGR